VTTAEDLAFHGEAASLIVSQAQSSGTVHRAEDSVLLEQVVDDRLLVSMDPAGEQQEEERERGRQLAHDWSLPERQPSRNGCELGQPAPSQWAEIPEANAFVDGTFLHHDVTAARASRRAAATSGSSAGVPVR
jgi:hypothetical protein